MTGVLGEYRIDDLRPEDRPVCERLTFPAYRHLLALARTLRHPGEGDQWPILPLGVVARLGGRIIALALAEVPVEPGGASPELLSLYVDPDHRGKGVATRLVEAVEQVVSARGFGAIEAVYTTGRASQPAVERIFEKRGWQPPERRTVSVRFTIEEALAAPWYGRIGVPEGAEIFPWTGLTADERRRLIESNEAAPWIPASLQPWRHDRIGFDPDSSLGMRYRGDVVGWVINHRISDDTVRFTCSFMRGDLSRRARILPLYTESVRRLAASGCRFCTFVTPTVYPPMVEFIERHCRPYASFTGETRGTRKALAGGPVGTPNGPR